MMTRKIAQLLEKYQTGTITSEERAFLESWYVHYRAEGEEYNEHTLLEDASRVQEQLQKQLGHRRRSIGKDRSLPNRTRTAVAAAAVLVFATLALSIYFYVQHQRPGDSILQYDTTHIHPGGNRASLTLADGSVIDLSGDQSGIIIGQDRISYDDGTSVITGPNVSSILSLSTPRGGQYQVTLPDGTKVWLNAASTLRYPTRFTEPDRRVELVGEAYFEVVPAGTGSPDGSRFIVNSPQQEVTVLGTHFNIAAYTDDHAIKTTLMEGAVRVAMTAATDGGHSRENDRGDLPAPVVLTPGQEAALANGNIDVYRVNPDNALAWKNGIFHFDDVPLEEIMRQISRWYDVEVEYRGANKSDRFGGSFYRSDDISAVLRKLELTGAIHFKIEGRRVVAMD